MRYAIVALFLLGGCASSLMPRQPVQQSVLLAVPQDQAYTRAVQTLVAMGASNLQSDQRAGVVSSTVHGAVAMTVRVSQEGAQSKVDVTGVLLPGKLVIGSFTETQEFVQLLTQTP